MSFNVYFETDGGLWVEPIEDNHISKFLARLHHDTKSGDTLPESQLEGR